jgi:hypothetical protein
MKRFENTDNRLFVYFLKIIPDYFNENTTLIINCILCILNSYSKKRKVK